MDSRILTIVLISMVVLSFIFSIIALIIQIMRKNKVDKMAENINKEQANPQPYNAYADQAYNQANNAQHVQRPIVNYNPNAYEERTQSLWSNPETPYATVSSSYKMYINESSDTGSRAYELNITEELTIGRAGTSGLFIDNPTVSGLQCVLIARPEGIYAENRSGSNVTRLNGAILSSSQILKPHDTLKLGRVDLTIVNIQKTI